MDQRLSRILEALLSNIEVLNNEMSRMIRSEQFNANPRCSQLMEEIRSHCLCSLQNVRSMERKANKAISCATVPVEILPLRSDQ